ncbi:hypothetical protein V8D89_000868 [Ganoderma adspersum]
MPTLHSLSIRRRGTTRTDNSTKPSVANTAHAVYTIKSLFHRKTSSNRKASSDSDRSDNKMGNAPSDMSQGKANGAAVAGTPSKTNPQLVRASTISDGSSSIRSRPMPGAEPPTPIPAEPVMTKDAPPKTPRMEQVQVQVPVQDDSSAGTAEEERNLEAGVPSVGTFEVEEASAAQEAPAADPAVRTPRPELKTEELLAPLDLTPSSPPMSTSHAPEPSDATTTVAVSPARSTKGLMAALPMWTPGTYVLLNARGGTAMDLHGGDNTSVIGYPMHGSQNQQWEFIPSGHGYVIRCVRPSKAGHALYLTVEDGVRNNAPVVASAYPVAWNVEQTEEGIIISWPNSNFVFDLADWGDNAPGTKIQLMPLLPGELCQLWHYTRCAPAERDEKGMEIEVQSARAISPPATTETVTVSESRDFVTTTRTTTTTVITTVTEVTSTPRALLRQPAHQQPQPQRRSIGYM